MAPSLGMVVSSKYDKRDYKGSKLCIAYQSSHFQIWKFVQNILVSYVVPRINANEILKYQ